MEEQTREKNNDQTLKNRNDWATTEADFNEETAEEVAPKMNIPTRNESNDTINKRNDGMNTGDREGTGGKVMGAIAIILSIMSLFYSPILFSAAGIIIGFIARQRGAKGLGNTAIAIGVVAMIIALIIVPFF